MSDVSSQRYLLKTLGCKANLYDSQLIEAELLKRGWSAAANETESSVGLCIVNSCTVTDEADRQSRKLASRLARLHPDAKVVITGCAAEVDPERLARSTGIHYVVGNQDKPRLVDLVLSKLKEASSHSVQATQGEILGSVSSYEEIRSKHPVDREWPLPEASFAAPLPYSQGESARTRAFLKIQEGCNSFCTYCIIPYGRGPARSLDADSVIQQVSELASAKVREIVITGTNIGDYGVDWGDSNALEKLLGKIFRETSIERVRVSSLDPVEITPGILELMQQEERFCPHFHVSLQSPHPRILRLMKRKYSWEHVESCLTAISRLSSPAGRPFVGMDLITGFPGETEEEFEWTMKALQSLPWSRLHVFPYSERAGTPATRLPQSVPAEVRAERARRLRELSLSRLKSIYLQTQSDLKDGALEGVLVEGLTRLPHSDERRFGGYTKNYLRVLLPESRTNEVVRARVTGVLEDPQSGEVSFLADEILES